LTEALRASNLQHYECREIFALKWAPWFLTLAALALGILLCEGLLAVFYPQLYRRPPRIWQFDGDLGWAHVPEGKGRLVTPEFDVEMHINKEGLRGGNYERKKPDRVRRILVFGDSFAEGWGVKSEEAVSEQLQKCLQSDRTDSIEVINFGVAGYGTDQELLLYEKLGKLYEPDVVVVLFYGNDLWNNASKRGIGAERGYKPFFRPQSNGHLALGGVPVVKTRYWDEARYRDASLGTRLSRYLHENWHLYVLVNKALQPEIAPAQQSQYYDGLYGHDVDRQWQPVWELTGMLLEKFAAAVQSRGGEFIVVYVPAIVQIEEEDWQAKRTLHGLVDEYDLQKPNAHLTHFSQRYNLDYVDLYPVFKERGKDQVLYLRDSHWNAAGHELAAQTLCGSLSSYQGEAAR
jgi:lysophospholipase L1-like esterase